MRLKLAALFALLRRRLAAWQRQQNRLADLALEREIRMQFRDR